MNEHYGDYDLWCNSLEGVKQRNYIFLAIVISIYKILNFTFFSIKFK